MKRHGFHERMFGAFEVREKEKTNTSYGNLKEDK